MENQLKPQKRLSTDSPTSPVPAATWAQSIMDRAEEETRARPWQKEFGTPTTNDVNAEDWIDYPAAFNVSKKGIAG